MVLFLRHPLCGQLCLESKIQHLSSLNKHRWQNSFYMHVTAIKKKKKSTNMDNNLKSVPQRKLLRDDQKSSPAVYSQQIGGVWQSDRGMRGEMKEKHPCESEWYAKALRHLLVQYKESVRLVICQFLNKLHNTPTTTTTKEDEAAFYFPPRETCSNPRTSRGWVPDLESEQTDKKSWPVWFGGG